MFVKFVEQDIMVYANENGYFTRLSRKNFSDEWENAFLYISFKKGVDVPNKTKIHLDDAEQVENWQKEQ